MIPTALEEFLRRSIVLIKCLFRYIVTHMKGLVRLRNLKNLQEQNGFQILFYLDCADVRTIYALIKK